MLAFFSKRWIAALRVTACILVILACQLPSLITQPVGVPENATQPAGVPAAATQLAGVPATPRATAEATSEAIQGEVEYGPGSFSLVDPPVGLADLSSYKATLKLSFNSTQTGQPSQWTHTYVMLANQESAAHQITIMSDGGVPAPVFIAEVNGVRYELDGENKCTVSTTEAGTSLADTWEPVGFLTPIIGAEPAGSETVNGVASDRYTFDERALGEAGFTQSTGQVWVASDKGVVVRYLLATTAGVDYFGEGIEGILTWEYNLTELNQPVTIDLPANCTAGLVNAPLMPDAQSVRRTPGLTFYSTATSIPDVLAFYQAQLPALGWAAAGEPSVADTIGWVSFVQGDQQLTVIATPTNNGVEVRLLKGTPPSSIP